jgi:hypothetical protein
VFGGNSTSAGGRRQACFSCSRCAGRENRQARPLARARQWRRGRSLESWGPGRRRWSRWDRERGVGTMVPAMLPRSADLHDSRGRPVSEMDGSPDIVDRTAMQPLRSAGAGAGAATAGEHWTFSVSAGAQRGTCRQGACSKQQWLVGFCLVWEMKRDELAGRGRSQRQRRSGRALAAAVGPATIISEKKGPPSKKPTNSAATQRSAAKSTKRSGLDELSMGQFDAGWAPAARCREFCALIDRLVGRRAENSRMR